MFLHGDAFLLGSSTIFALLHPQVCCAPAVGHIAYSVSFRRLLGTPRVPQGFISSTIRISDAFLTSN